MRSLLRTTTVLILALVVAFVLPAAAQSGSTASKAIPCNLSAFVDGVTVTTQLVAAPTGTTTIFINGTPTTVVKAAIHICGVTYRVVQGATPQAFGLAYGTGANCVTGTTNLTPQWSGTASVTDTLVEHYGSDAAVGAPAGKAVCLRLAGAPTGARALITYAVY